jgi:DNA-binding GntR family transcriptional regulator
MKQFDKDKSLPLYIQVANWIRSRVITGLWPKGFKLPRETELAEQLEVSRGTLRKAMALLTKDKIIEQTQGKGTFVGATIFEQSWAYKLTTTSEELNWEGIPFRIEVLELAKRRVNDHRIYEILSLLSHQDRVIVLKRLRYVDEIPVVMHTSFFPADKYSELLKIDFTKETMTGALENILDVKVAWAEHTISAIYADSEISKYLQMNDGEPVIYDEHTLYNDKDEVVEFTKGWFRGDRFRLKTIVHRDK